ncbi:hypothetical protein GIB64_05530 [Pseudomonas lactis]|uniref:hypothetical protein n=1 Tax=Pseudomonas TaxID=286 RepID=UPI000BB5C56C|nr:MULTISPECIES: hypothetical protein [Pseudomonas]MBA5956881.1 hypothetical protein [Pseudomonas lactis]PRW73014.1 hypothetical protein C7A12_23905 [Pseudomonas fluorescens]
MNNYQALEHGSQGSNNPVLFLNVSAPSSELMDAANWRLGAARDLLEVLTVSSADDGFPRDVAKVSRALLLLMDDAESLYQAARALV